MKVFIHGLGQGPGSWDKTLDILGRDESCLCPDLAGLLGEKQASYENLYTAFSNFCGTFKDKADMCGLSLGSVLALHYAIDHPQKVSSLVLIAPRYKMPRTLLRLQNAAFHLMPGSVFQQTGFGKAGFIQLCRTMIPLDLSQSLEKISCPTLILCGEKDTANRKNAMLLADMLGNARFQAVGASGHECNVDAPENLAEVIRQFWNRK